MSGAFVAVARGLPKIWQVGVPGGKDSHGIPERIGREVRVALGDFDG